MLTVGPAAPLLEPTETRREYFQVVPPSCSLSLSLVPPCTAFRWSRDTDNDRPQEVNNVGTLFNSESSFPLRWLKAKKPDRNFLQRAKCNFCFPSAAVFVGFGVNKTRRDEDVTKLDIPVGINHRNVPRHRSNPAENAFYL